MSMLSWRSRTRERTPSTSTRMSTWMSPMGIVALTMLVSLIFLVVAGPLIWGSAADRVNTAAILRGPSSAHPFGTDNLGRDLFARVMTATRLSLVLAVLATLLGAAAGVVLGSLTAVAGPRGRRVLGALINLLLAFPGLLVAIFFSVILGAGSRGAVFALAIAYIAAFARITQTLAASVAGSDFIAAARVLGVRRYRLLGRHILPNIAEPLLLNTAMTAGGTLLGLAGLSFLGLGVRPPGYDWGLLLSQGLDRIFTAPLPAIAPGIAIVYASLTFQLVGEVLAGRARHETPLSPGTPPTPRDNHVHESSDHGDQTMVLHVENLTVRFPTKSGTSTPVRGVSLSIRPGEIVGLVGESGSGKSLTALAIADLAPEAARVSWESNRFLGQAVDALPRRARRELLATGMAMIFQNPASALNPSLRIRTQLTEAVRLHHRASRADATRRAKESLTQVSLPANRRLLRAHPFQLSGGMRQRVMIAMGLMMRPKLIIADEPTTSLDVTVQRQILELLSDIRDGTGAAIVFISHDVALVSELCDRVLVMYGGHIVENLPVARLVSSAAHPYTRALIDSVPDLRTDRGRPLVTIDGASPDPRAASDGCPFAPRCPHRQATCEVSNPVLSPVGVEHEAACWHPVAPRSRVIS